MNKRSKFGILAALTAFPAVSSRKPKPSKIINATGFLVIMLPPSSYLIYSILNFNSQVQDYH